MFKREPDRYIVTAVEFAPAAQRRAAASTTPALREELEAMGIDAPRAAHVADAVIAASAAASCPIRRVIGNAGSFFKNPIVPRDRGRSAARPQHPALPVFRGNDDGTRKLSAAWLIEQCGWKGYRDGDAGVAAAHALVLVNHGHATGAQLLDLARRIAGSVQRALRRGAGAGTADHRRGVVSAA